MIAVQISKLYKVAWADPAGGPTSASPHKKGLSRASICVLGEDTLERIFILETWAARIPPDKLIERIFDTYRKWNVSAFGIDATGGQLMFAQLIQKEARERAIRLPLRPLSLRLEKTFSIETSVQPPCAAGRLFRPSESQCGVLKEEWRSFPTSDYLDAMDALACAIRMLPSILPEHMRRMSKEHLRAYLERSGTPKDQVELRLQQHQEFAME